MSKKLLIGIWVGFFIGIILFAGLRMILVKNDDVHFHANFGLFVNGEREKFDNFTFYEEVAACSASEVDNPKHNAHMHDATFDVVHVHAHAATWGAFFANLSFTLGNKVLVTDKVTFVDGQDGKKLQVILNGKPVQTVENRVIQSEDALLVSYGSEDGASLDNQYKQIAHSAADYNKKPDPAACRGSKPLTFSERLKRAFTFSN